MSKSPSTVSVSEGTAPQQQPQATNTPVQTNNEPQKTVYLSQNPKKEAASFQGMTVAQKLNYLQVKDKRGILTPKERQQKEDFEKQLKEEGNEGNITPEDGTKIGDKDSDPKDIFKEEDIIKYMYNDWLIGGANWLYKQIYKQIDKHYERFKNRVRQAKAQANVKYNTHTTRDTIDDKAVKSYEGSKAAIEKSREDVKNILADIAAGKIDASKASGFTKILMNELPEDKRNAFCASAVQKIENLAENMKAIQFMAGQLARAQMAEAICKNQDAFKNTNPAQLHEAITKRNAIILARNIDEIQQRGGDPKKFMTEMNEQIEKANKFADKEYKKERFDEAGKKAKDNKVLRSINERLGIKQEETTKSDRLEPKSMLEHLVATNNFENLLTKELENNKRQAGALASQRDNNNNRRETFKARVSIIRGNSHALKPITKEVTFNQDAYRKALASAQGR